ncbi:replication initiator protein [Microviridae sp.]|nr:replication initiator protein [Microviridae sp.]
MQLSLPCGKCEGCLKKRLDMWALRCMHESNFHDENCFITLTYDDDCLPKDGSLDHSHFQKFMKRLRKRFTDKKIRYFMCGEYGAESLRPHFHALLFGVDFHDKTEFTSSGNVINYISPTLSDLWPFGFHLIGNLHYGTARYVAKYSLKALGQLGYDYDVLNIRPEYLKMSTGIGRSHAIKFSNEIGVHDNLIVNGFKNPVPRYYEDYLDSSHLQHLKDERVKNMVSSSLHELNIKRIIKGKEAKLWKR